MGSAAGGDVQLRLTRDNAFPSATNTTKSIFALQDKKQDIIPGARGRDGKLVFDFTLQVKPGVDRRRPDFGGRFANQTTGDRFVYLFWRSVPRGVYINRLKARLGSIAWKAVRAA